MLTYEDCLGICDLTEEEIEAIAEHEHIPEIAAMEMGEYLVNSKDGVPKIKKIILDDIKNAEDSGNTEHADKLRKILKHFIATHPSRKK
ncbi:MAG: hypothetical protein D6B28_03275 [Gammaproteobacteria bacterium]|nr:MAG: hypothetical protein D6B28_03275 [Gammaproteobacteria bacterium]